MNSMRAVHPGEVLQEDFLVPLGMSRNKLAIALGLSAPRVNDICLGRRPVTLNTALRLSYYFGTTPQFWMSLQMKYDLKAMKRSAMQAIRRQVRKPYRALEPDSPIPQRPVGSKAAKSTKRGARKAPKRITLALK